MSDTSRSEPDAKPDQDPERDPDPNEAVGDFGDPHQSDEGGDSDVDLTSGG